MKELFDSQLRGAIKKYTDKHIDILITKERDVYGIYHSNNNSFDVTYPFPLDKLGGVEALKKYEEEFENLCICEDY